MQLVHARMLQDGEFRQGAHRTYSKHTRNLHVHDNDALQSCAPHQQVLPEHAKVEVGCSTIGWPEKLPSSLWSKFTRLGRTAKSSCTASGGMK
jgi:hypothetical protein